MSAKAGTIGLSQRPTGFVVWTAIVSVLAAAALVMSAVALTKTRDQGVAGAAATESAGTVVAQAPLWDARKLEAMEGRVVAASVGPQGYTLWDVGKLEAMAGRVLANGPVEDHVPWDEAKLEAMAGRAQAG